MRPELPPAIFLMGPTATGKTELALELYSGLPVELISVDSVMVYRGMDIGTAKPDAALRLRVPHRLVDILDPADAYSAWRFRGDALTEMAEITRQGRVPLLVGGTGLYFRSLETGLSRLPSGDPVLRRRIALEAGSIGWPALHARLASLDPEAAARIHPNDPQRVQRALEIVELSGNTSAALHPQVESTFPYRAIKVLLLPEDRSLLRRRIAERFQDMLDKGLMEEVKGLHGRGDLTEALPSMRAVGYRQAWQFLEGRWDFDTMSERAVTATRQLAKRQMTWLRDEPNARRFKAAPGADANAVLKFLRKTL